MSNKHRKDFKFVKSIPFNSLNYIILIISSDKEGDAIHCFQLISDLGIQLESVLQFEMCILLESVISIVAE